MHPRQKIIAIAIAVPAVALIAYMAATDTTRKGRSNRPRASIAATAAPAKKVVPNLEKVKNNARKALARLETLTDQDYAGMRKRRPQLPASLAEYKKQVTERAQQTLALTQPEFDARLAARAEARSKGRPKGKGAPAEGAAPADAPRKEEAPKAAPDAAAP